MKRVDINKFYSTSPKIHANGYATDYKFDCSTIYNKDIPVTSSNLIDKLTEQLTNYETWIVNTYIKYKDLRNTRSIHQHYPEVIQLLNKIHGLLIDKTINAYEEYMDTTLFSKGKIFVFFPTLS